MKLTDARRTIHLLFVSLDPTTIRVILMVASFGWAIALLVSPQTFGRHGFEFLGWLANPMFWVVVFFAHGLGVLWRFLDPKSRPLWSLVINSYGLWIWFCTTAATNVAVGGISPASAMEWTMTFAAALALVKTGFQREVVTL